MRKIEERIDEKTIEVEVVDPYLFCLDLMSTMEKYGEVIEKKNSIQTGGPRSRIDIVGSIKNSLDSRTDVFVSFSMQGSMVKNTGNITLNYVVDVISRFKEKQGIVSETFEKFYKKELEPELKKVAHSHIKNLFSKIERDIKNLARKYKT